MAEEAKSKWVKLAGWVKNHPLVVIIGVVFSLVGGTATVSGLVYNAKLEQEKADYQKTVAGLEQSLSSIQRTIGGDTDDLDVSGMLVSQDEASELGRAEYFPDESYYALDGRDESEWTVRETNEWQLLVDTIGPDEAAQLFEPSGVKAMQTLRVRVWSKDKSHRIVFPGQTGETMTVSPQVFVQQISVARAAQLMLRSSGTFMRMSRLA